MLQVFYVFILTLAALGTSHAQEAVAATAGGSQSTELRTTVQVQALTGIIESLGNEIARVEDDLGRRLLVAENRLLQIQLCNAQGKVFEPDNAVADAGGCVAKTIATAVVLDELENTDGTSCTGWGRGGEQNNTCTDTFIGKIHEPSTRVDVLVEFLAIRTRHNGGNLENCTAAMTFIPGHGEQSQLVGCSGPGGTVSNRITVREDGTVIVAPYSANYGYNVLGYHRYINYRSFYKVIADFDENLILQGDNVVPPEALPAGNALLRAVENPPADSFDGGGGPDSIGGDVGGIGIGGGIGGGGGDAGMGADAASI